MAFVPVCPRCYLWSVCLFNNTPYHDVYLG